MKTKTFTIYRVNPNTKKVEVKVMSPNGKILRNMPEWRNG